MEGAPQVRVKWFEWIWLGLEISESHSEAVLSWHDSNFSNVIGETFDQIQAKVNYNNMHHFQHKSTSCTPTLLKHTQGAPASTPVVVLVLWFMSDGYK